MNPQAIIIRQASCRDKVFRIRMGGCKNRTDEWQSSVPLAGAVGSNFAISVKWGAAQQAQRMLLWKIFASSGRTIHCVALPALLFFWEKRKNYFTVTIVFYVVFHYVEVNGFTPLSIDSSSSPTSDPKFHHRNKPSRGHPDSETNNYPSIIPPAT